jgi:hypothetical protein
MYLYGTLHYTKMHKMQTFTNHEIPTHIAHCQITELVDLSDISVDQSTNTFATYCPVTSRPERNFGHFVFKQINPLFISRGSRCAMVAQWHPSFFCLVKKKLWGAVALTS